MGRNIMSVLAVLALMNTSALQAQFIAGPNPTQFGNCVPFGCHSVSRYQQVYSAGLLSTMGPMSIGRVSFLYSSLSDAQLTSQPLQAASYTLRFSTTSAVPGALSIILDNNVDGDPDAQHVFGIGTVSTDSMLAPNGTLDFNATNPFFYNPATDGNLLLDILIAFDSPLLNTYTPSNTAYLNTTDPFFTRPPSPDTFSRAYYVETGDTFLAQGGHADAYGLVTMFGPASPQTVVPEPTTIGLLATGLIGIAGAARRRRQRGIPEDS